MVTTLVYIILAALFLWGLGNLFTGPLQDHFIMRIHRLPADHQLSFPADFEEVFLKGPRHGKLHGVLFRQPEAKGVILFLHGNSGNVSRWGHLHRFFFRFQYDFFVYDYRGFGKSRGPRTESLLHADARAAYDFLRGRYATEEIVIFGRSLGSAFASRLAASAPARLLILETPFAGMVDLFYTYYPFLPRVFRFKYRLDNLSNLHQVNCPVFIFQGTSDYVVPMRSAARLKTALKPGDEFIIIEKGRHNDLMIHDIYHQKMQEILGRDQNGTNDDPTVSLPGQSPLR